MKNILAWQKRTFTKTRNKFSSPEVPSLWRNKAIKSSEPPAKNPELPTRVKFMAIAHQFDDQVLKCFNTY